MSDLSENTRAAAISLLATALAAAEARGRRQGLEGADDREVERILGLTEAQVIAEIEAEGRDPEALAEAMRGQMGATFKLCEEIKTLRDALADNARVDAVLKAILTPAGDPEHGDRDHLPRVLRDFLNEECGRAGLTGFNDGYAEGYAKALATAPAEMQKPDA